MRDDHQLARLSGKEVNLWNGFVRMNAGRWRQVEKLYHTEKAL
jgi:hypothetical protein